MVLSALAVASKIGVNQCIDQLSHLAYLLLFESDMSPVLHCLTSRLDLERCNLGVADGSRNAI